MSIQVKILRVYYEGALFGFVVPVTIDKLKPGMEIRATVEETSREWITVFCGATGDFNPIHLDRVAAERAGFNDIILPGMMTASRALGVLQQAGIFQNVIMLEEECRFIKPAYQGDKIQYVFRFDEITRIPGDMKVIVRMSFSANNEGGNKLAEGHFVFLVRE